MSVVRVFEAVGAVLWWSAAITGAVVVCALVAVGCNWRLLVLRHRLGKFFDGDGLAKVYRGAGQVGAEHLRPKVWKYRHGRDGYKFLIRTANGVTRQVLTDKADALAQHLRVAEVRVESTGKPGRAQVLAYRHDPAPMPFSLAELVTDRKSGSQSMALDGVPIGRKDDGSTFRVSLGHTLIVGATGSGKGSVLWAYLMGASRVLGRCGRNLKIYGYDPKHAELAGVGGGRFESIAYDPADALVMFRALVEEMRTRQALGQRSFAPTSDTPFVLLVIDEFNTLTTAADSAWRRDVRESLHALLSQGRSAGIYLVAAAQQPQKESIGEYRPHFQNRLYLRVETPTEAEIVLGVGSVDSGVKPHLIAPATESNGYRTAGIGYARSDAEPDPVRFRAPKVEDADIVAWCAGGDRHE